MDKGGWVLFFGVVGGESEDGGWKVGNAMLQALVKLHGHAPAAAAATRVAALVRFGCCVKERAFLSMGNFSSGVGVETWGGASLSTLRRVCSASSVASQEVGFSLFLYKRIASCLLNSGLEVLLRTDSLTEIYPCFKFGSFQARYHDCRENVTLKFV